MLLPFNGIKHPIRTSCCMQTFNQWRQRPWVEILISVFLWQQPISTLKLNPLRATTTNRMMKKAATFSPFPVVLWFLHVVHAVVAVPFFVCKFQTQCARAQSMCACVKIISKVICWRNVISRQCWETWCTKVRHVHIERTRTNEWTHIKMRFAMAIFVWHASLLRLLPLYYSTEFMSNWILNSLTFLSVPCNPEPSMYTCMHSTGQIHYTHWKWKMERTHTHEKKTQNEIKVNCVVAFDSAFCSVVSLCVRPLRFTLFHACFMRVFAALRACSNRPNV